MECMSVQVQVRTDTAVELLRNVREEHMPVGQDLLVIHVQRAPVCNGVLGLERRLAEAT